jgi:hypothetical protein
MKLLRPQGYDSESKLTDYLASKGAWSVDKRHRKPTQ